MDQHHKVSNIMMTLSLINNVPYTSDCCSCWQYSKFYCQLSDANLIMQDDPQYNQSDLAAISNCLEIQSNDHRRIANAVRARVANSTSGSVNQFPAACSICLEELDWQALSEDKAVKIILPACMHSFHLKCLGEWRCKSSACPDCRSRAMPQALDQMLLAGVALHGEDTWLGQTCRCLSEGVQGAQDPISIGMHFNFSMDDLPYLQQEPTS